MEKEVNRNWDSGRKKSLVFVYYAGHGVMDNMNYVVCNGGESRKKFIYPLEAKLKALA